MMKFSYKVFSRELAKVERQLRALEPAADYFLVDVELRAVLRDLDSIKLMAKALDEDIPKELREFIRNGDRKG